MSSGIRKRPVTSNDDSNIELGSRPTQAAPSTQNNPSSTGYRAPKRTTKFNQKLTVFPGEYDGAGSSSHTVPEHVEPPPHVSMDVAKPPFRSHQQGEEFLQRVDKNSLPRATAYCTANSYKMDHLMEYLISRKFLNATSPKRYDEVIYTPYGVIPQDNDSCEYLDEVNDVNPLASFSNVDDSSNGTFLVSTDGDPVTRSPRSRPKTGTDAPRDSTTTRRTRVTYADLVRKTTVPELFFFDYGVVVMWGLTEEEEGAILNEIKPFQEDPIDPSELEPERFRYLYSKQQQPRIYNDIITLISPNTSVMIKLTISHACAQSAKLTLFEGLVEETIESTRHIPRVLAETGKIHMTRSAVTKTIGKLFLMRTNVNLVSNVLDTPDIFWSQPALEPLYYAIRGYLEISQRVDLINQRVNVISEMMTMLQENVNLVHGELLEWIVIILITLELAIDLKKDPKYKKYVFAVDKILQSFDLVNEWADVIGFLSRLLKTLQAHSHYSIVPRKLIVAKRLAQCLNPALPAGVHQKSIEVYNVIFESAGPAQLAEDLPLWSYGLFPFLQHAAMSVKLPVLSLYERFYLPLGPRLKPALKGFILALLPALEEEGNEFFDTVVKMLNKICDIVESTYFFHCMCLAILSVNHLRGAAMHYLLRRIPKFTSAAESDALFGSDKRLLARALAAVLEDRQILVQRAGLEILVVHFPMEMGHFPPNELEIIIRSAVTVVLRKDMSLNRRLYTWLMGGSGKLNATSRPIVSATLKDMFWLDSNELAEIGKPYRVMISLLDKAEIGSVILEDIFIDVLGSLQDKYLRSANQQEILQTAGMLLGNIDSYTMWRQIYDILKISPFASSGDSQVYQLVDFALKHINTGDEDVYQIHLPVTLHLLTSQLQQLETLDQFLKQLDIFPLFLGLFSQILERIPPEATASSWIFVAPTRETRHNSERRFSIMSNEDSETLNENLGDTNGEQDVDDSASKAQTLTEKILILSKDFYQLDEGGDRRLLGSQANEAWETRARMLSQLPIIAQSFANLWEFLVKFIDVVVIRVFGDGSDAGPQVEKLTAKERHTVTVTLELICRLVETLSLLSDSFISRNDLHRSQEDVSSGAHRLLHNKEWLVSLVTCAQKSTDFPTLNICLGSFLNVYKHGDLANFSMKRFCAGMTSQIWNYLDPDDYPAFNTRAAELLWRLCNVTPFGSSLIEDVMSQFLSARDLDVLRRHYRNFGVFWKLTEDRNLGPSTSFSRPFFLIIDSLRSENPRLKREAEVWYKTYVKNHVRVVEPVIALLMQSNVEFKSVEASYGEEKFRTFKYLGQFNLMQTIYAMQTLVSMLDFSHRLLLKNVWFTPVQQFRSFNMKTLAWCSDEFKISPIGMSGAELIVLMCLRFIKGEFDLETNARADIGILKDLNLCLQSEAVNVLTRIISLTDIMTQKLFLIIFDELLGKIFYTISHKEFDLQVRLLYPMQALVGMLSRKNVIQESARAIRKKESITISASLDSLLASAVPGAPSSALDATSSSLKTLVTSQRFIKMMLDGLTQRQKDSVLQHWIDFILHILPFLKAQYKKALHPLVRCFSELLVFKGNEALNFIDAFRAAYGTSETGSETMTAAAKRETKASIDFSIVRILYGLEKVLAFSLVEDTIVEKEDKTGALFNLWEAKESEDRAGPAAEATSSLWSLTDYVSSVLIGDSSAMDSATAIAQRYREATFTLLPGILNVVKHIFILFQAQMGSGRNRNAQPQRFSTSINRTSNASTSSANLSHPGRLSLDESATPAFGIISGASLSSRCVEIEERIEKMLSTIFQNHPGELIEAMIVVWYNDNREILRSIVEFPAFEAYDVNEKIAGQSGEQIFQGSALSMLHSVHGCTPRVVMSTILEGLRARAALANGTLTVKEKGKSVPFRSPTLSDAHLVFFLAVYAEGWADQESLNDSWASIISFLRDTFPGGTTSKTFLLPSALRLVTASLDKLVLSRYFEDKRVRREADSVFQNILDLCTVQGSKLMDNRPNQRRNLAPKDHKTLALTALKMMETNPLNNFTLKPSDKLVPFDVVTYFTWKVVPNVRKLILDQERIITVFTNAVYYIVGPFLKSKASTATGGECLGPALELLFAMSKLPFATKAWRKEVWDLFLENRFFSIDLAALRKWKTIFQALMVSDKELKIADLIGKITATPSTSLFVSREYEVLTRSYTLRRLSFALWCGSIDQYLPQLPSIQEKLVEVLKGPPNLMHVEAYLCLRILIIRMSTHHLNNLWPILLTELIRVFGVYLRDQGTKDDLLIFFAACKLVDLLIVLGVEEFQWHKWIFVSETVEEFVAKDSLPRNASLVDKLTISWNIDDGGVLPDGSSMNVLPGTVTRKPLLHMKKIKDKSELIPFVQRLNFAAYENVFTRSKPDYAFIESLLELDLLDQDLPPVVDTSTAFNSSLLDLAETGDVVGELPASSTVDKGKGSLSRPWNEARASIEIARRGSTEINRVREGGDEPSVK
ncbi:hypothetical protein HDU76_010223 [Blyttiomyces sp. JEL0837]|nr:hypothetical protein HDU76_010223 [Blyttiomyces sp. JEL0837]